MKKIKPEDNLHAADSLIEDASSCSNDAEALDQLWQVATMIMGKDNPNPGGCMSARGSIESLMDIVDRMTGRLKKFSPEQRLRHQKHIDQIVDRIHIASGVSKEVADQQKANRASAGSFLGFRQTT